MAGETFVLGPWEQQDSAARHDDELGTGYHHTSVTEILLAELSGLSMLSNKVVCFLEILPECLCISTCRRRRRVTRQRVEHEVDREMNLHPEH